MSHLLGIDLGTSAVKAALLDAGTGKVIASCQSPARTEFKVSAKQPAWAEQDPLVWWSHTQKAIAMLAKKQALNKVTSIGIAYQMHGLVLLDAAGRPVRPSIIWSDSRAVQLGRAAAEALGAEAFASSTLNAPGNFTASKWAWVAKHEPQVLAKAETVMLPGDYLAFCLTGQRSTTAGGLGEMMLWDFRKQALASQVIDHFDLNSELLPPLVPTFGGQSTIKAELCSKFGFRQNTRLTYRAGDQPNNAYALKVLHAGETAATAGTSGVLYTVSDEQIYDDKQRLNTFAHVNCEQQQRLGLLMCINGTGAAYAWLRRMLGAGGVMPGYQQLNKWAESAAVGSDGLLFYPWGNGAERLLGNDQRGASLQNLNFARHGPAELSAAVQDGIAAAFALGREAFAELGVVPRVVRAARSNMFLSSRFCQAFTQLTHLPLQLYDTNGAEGAARAAGRGGGEFASHEEALQHLACEAEYEPRLELAEVYGSFYEAWKSRV